MDDFLIIPKPKACTSCGSLGFAPSRMLGRCEYCDGTFGGNPPTTNEIIDWNIWARKRKAKGGRG